EPQRRLSPIQGYEKKDLVSLEEAVKPLENLIQNIEGFVWTATGNCENPLEGLTPNERAAIYLYTMECMYHQLNKALRNENRQQLVPYFSYLKLLLTGLWKLPSKQCLVYRGVKANISQQYPVGKKFAWWGLSSCTGSLNILQREQFLVLSKLDQGNGLHIVHIKQIEPPIILIQPPSPSLVQSHQVTDTAATKKTLNLNVLREKPRLCVKIPINGLFMGANDDYLLFSSQDDLLLVDKQGAQKLKTELDHQFEMHDICWASYLNQFLILVNEGSSKDCLHSLYITGNETGKLKETKKFDQEMISCTSYNDIFLINSKGRGEGDRIEEYQLSN
ncbi:unnamed protein product, partial [Adineta steineri]